MSDVSLPSGADVDELDEKFYDFLVTYTTDEALENVERFQGKGLALRQFKARYNPAGGRADFDCSMRMLLRKPCKHINELLAAID